MNLSSKITKWLKEPGKVSEEEKLELAEIIRKYPYFIPAKYVEAATLQQRTPFAPVIMDHLKLYSGNWLLLHEFLQSCSERSEVEYFEPSPLAENYVSRVVDEMEYPLEKEETTQEEIDFAAFNIIEEHQSIRDFNEETMIEEEMDFALEEEPFATPLSGAHFPNFDKEEFSEPKKKSIEEKKEASLNWSQSNQIEEKDLEESIIQPIYSEDYFLHQGISVSDEIPEEVEHKKEKSLMVMMSFSEWLQHYKNKGERQKEEEEDQKALKTMWQKEKLAAALEEENDEIPENVFEMAVNSITKEDDLASESLAEILVKQGKLDKALEMYKKLSLRNPQKKAYFARKIDQIQKEKES